MRAIVPLLVLLAACSSSPPLELAPQVPPLQLEQPKADPERDRPARADADRSPPLPTLPPAAAAGDGEPIAFRSVVQVVEVPVATTSTQYEPTYAVQYPVTPARGAATSRRGGWFPYGTAMGAGIGAVIGNRSGHAGRGAFLGSNIGFLFDAARWWF